ncbi:MAG TPA: c-type cytochrome [Kofleriaceae bacterium]|nr:c-type cytochrome [Kofleriaceae bacterium]
MRRLLLLATIAACSRGTRPPASVAPVVHESQAPAAANDLMSDPDEYRIDHVSRDAGEAIFTRTGIGDPYRAGVPYPIFLALLRAYPELFGHDTQELAARFGFVARTPDPSSTDLDLREGLPLGMHLTTDPYTGVQFVVTNCALCHAERLHLPDGDRVVIGLGSKHVRIHAYDAAFADAARRADFGGEKLAPLADEEAAAHHVSWGLDWRVPLVKATLDAMTARAKQRAELIEKTRNGPPGRVAPIESFALVLGAMRGTPIKTNEAVGWSKVPDVIGFAQRVTLSWDAAGEGPMDVLVVEADVAAGVRPDWFWRHPLQGASLGAFLRQPRRELRFPGSIDRKLAAKGKQLFEDNCARCHGDYADDGHVIRYDEQVVPLDVVGTDPARANAVTDDFLAAANDPKITRELTHARHTGGYVPPVLTGVWARAPFGHAGQWPSLAVMATPPADRAGHFAPYVFDPDAPYDLIDVGLAHHRRKELPGPFEQIVGAPPISPLGHPFLADLGPDARAVVEYLKTL